MKAHPLIWNFPDQYKKNVVTLEPFHTGVNYMRMLFRLQEITTEAELVTSGCLENILRAKEYAKALFYLKTVSKLQNVC